MIRILEKKGFERVRSSGSHLIFRNAEGVRATIPFHAGKTLHPKIIKGILRDTGLSVDDISKGTSKDS